MAMKERDFTSSKGVWGFQRTRINIKLFINSFSIVVFVEEMTYNLINLKYQNSLNIGYIQIQLFLWWITNLNLFEDIRGFILDIPKDMKLKFFFYFWHLLCLSLIETFFAPLRIDRRILPFHSLFFFFSFFLHSLPQRFLGWPSIYGFFLLAFS